MKNSFSPTGKRRVDFAQEVLRSAETPEEVFSGKISYSAARDELFAFCPRAGFYRYYGAQGGWDPYAGAFARKVYRLKYMRTLEGEMARILSESLSCLLFHKGGEEEEYIPDNGKAEETFLKRWKYFASREVWKMGKLLEEEAWRNDPKMPDFLELHGPDPAFTAPRELMGYLIENMKGFFRETEEDLLFLPTLAHVPKEAWRSSLFFRDLTLENIPIFLPPFLMIQQNGILAKLSFSINLPGKEYHWKGPENLYGENATLSDRLFGSFAEKTFPGHTPEKWEAVYRNGRFHFHPAPVTPLSIIELRERSERLFAFSGSAPTLSAEDFPCREDKDTCRTCRYISLCKK